MPGRIISKANEQKIRDAIAQLKGMLSFLEDDDDAQEADTPQAEAEPIAEAALLYDVVPLVEQSLRGDGTALLKLIKPGWGSSGYYGREVLERDGPRVFAKGTKAYWNHPTASEEAQRPEGDLNNLAAELISDARYEWGPAGEGLYADAKIFGPYQHAVNELAPHIGVSIRASGRAQQGKAEGRDGPIIQEITRASSADFVTVAGAGGEIIQMFEAARASTRALEEVHIEPIEETQMTEAQLKEAIDAAVAKMETENARLRESLTLRDAKDQVRVELARTTLPDVTKARLLERLATNPPVKEGQLDSAALTERITAAVSDETQYLAAAAGYGSGRIEGMGGSAPAPDPKQQEAAASLAESLQRLGIGKDMAATVAEDWR